MSREAERMDLDAVDRLILNRIQTDFPIEARPYHELGRRLGLDEKDVLGRVRRMRETGVIRRIGGNFSAGAMGYASTLCAARVPEDRLDDFIAHVNRHPGVTHNYRRQHDWNVWFTVIARSREEIVRLLDEIAGETGIREILDLPAERTFKIRVDFRFD